MYGHATTIMESEMEKKMQNEAEIRILSELYGDDVM